MSRMLGEQLPSFVRERLNGEALANKVGPTIFLLSVDDAGFPHVALLSYGEVLAVSPREVRVLLWQSGGTARHLAEHQAACLALVEPALIVYIKGRARPLGLAVEGDLPLAGVALDVTQVLADEEAGTEMISAARYRYTDRSPEELVARWREQHAALRRLA